MGAGKRVISAHIAPFLAARSYKPASVKQRRQILGQFADHTGDPPAKDLSADHVLDWWGSLMGLAVASRRSHLSAVRVFCSHLVSIGAAKHNPTEVIARPAERNREPVTLKPREVIQLLRCLPTSRDRAMVSLMLGCALRSMEVSNLNVDDIDFTDRALTVRGGKGGKDRVVPIPQATIECLTDYLLEHLPPKTATGHGYGPLIRHHHSQERLMPAPVQQRVTKLLRDAGIKRGPHDGRSSHVLRRTCATTLLESGASIRDVQVILGHEELSSTQRYLKHPDQDRLVQLIDQGPLSLVKGEVHVHSSNRPA